MSFEQPTEPKEGDIKIVDDIKYRWTNSGYTVKQYFSHETPEKGPGPGWDRFASHPDDVADGYGLEWNVRFTPNDLPDTPYYYWKEVIEE